MNPEALKGHLDLLLMTAVEAGPTHGYAIAETLRTRSGQVFTLPEGTLYPALHRLERAGLLSSQWSEQSGRRRRVYRLTAKGHKALARKVSDWTAFSRAIEAVVRG